MVRLRLVSLLLLIPLPRLAGQSAPPAPLTATLDSAAAVRDPRAPLRLTLSRDLEPGDGALMVLVNAVDFSALSTRSGRQVTIDAGPDGFPRHGATGRTTVELFLARDGQWTPLASLPLRLRLVGGIDSLRSTPSIDIGGAQLLTDGANSTGTPGGDRRPNTTLSGGLQATLTRQRVALDLQSSLVGATRDEQALRFAQRGARAPQVDLSAWKLLVRSPGLQLEMGDVAMGRHRLLLNNFASRGVALTAGTARAQLTVGSIAGAPIVGWDNPLGLAERRHRMHSATATVEARPQRPGALQLRLTAMDGALVPQAGFTQGAVVDAEESRGGGVEVAAATPAQRATLALGFSQSAFVNPLRDGALTDGLAVPVMRRERRSARYAESQIGLLTGTPLFGRVPARLTLGMRHERIDPLYRSVGAFVQADREQDAVDLTGALGVVSWQAGLSRGRDNLAAVASVLTSHSRGQTGNLSTDLAALITQPRLRTQLRPWLPQVSASYQALHQFAAGVPASGDFRPQDLADQRTTNVEFNGQWRVRAWQVSARASHALQDNRQPSLASADFVSDVRSGSLGRALGARLDVSADAGIESQRNVARNEVGRVRRLGGNANWRPHATTGITVNLTSAFTRTPPATRDAVNLETRLELSQRLSLPLGGSRTRAGQLFLRYARTSVSVLTPVSTPDATGTTVPSFERSVRMQWSLNSGYSVKAF